MYSDQLVRSSPTVDFSFLSAAVCISGGILEVALFAFNAPGASLLAVGLAEVGSVAALAYMYVVRQQAGGSQRAKRVSASKEALTKGEMALLARLRYRSIVVVKKGDTWRPAGALPRASSVVDFQSLVRDCFIEIDEARGVAVISK
jgi:hypothetical protein